MPSKYPAWMYSAMAQYQELQEQSEQIRVHIEQELAIYAAETGADRELDYDSEGAWEELVTDSEQLCCDRED